MFAQNGNIKEALDNSLTASIAQRKAEVCET